MTISCMEKPDFSSDPLYIINREREVFPLWFYTKQQTLEIWYTTYINRNLTETFMGLDVLIPLIFAGLFLVVDIAMFIRVIYLLKKSKDDSVENLGNKLNPFLYATGVISVLMAICLMIVTVMK